MKLFGHPIHLMLVHFPAALFPFEWGIYLLYYITKRDSLAELSVYTLCTAVAIGWIALLFGALDLSKISSEKSDVIQRALIHGSINGTVLIGFTVLAWFAYANFSLLPAATLPLLIVKGLLVSCMIVGNYMGGNLVLKDHVGIKI